MKNNYSTVIFDLDGVLIEHDMHNEAKRLCKKLGVPYDDNMEQQYKDFWANFSKTFKNKKMTKELFAKGLEETIDAFKIHGKFGLMLYENLKSNDKIVKRHDYTNLLEEIKNKGKKLVALSDWFYDDQVRKLKELGYLDFFEEIYTFDDWYAKPDIRSIERIIKKGADTGSYIMIGDSLACDIAVSNKAGITSIWYNEGNLQKNNTEYKPDYQISSLYEMLEII